MEAFTFAVNNSKTDMLEMDVFLSKDKQVVVYHDDTLMRLNGSNKKISDYNFDELPEFLEEFKIDFNADDDYIY